MKNPKDEIRRLREAFHQAILADLREGVLSYHGIAVKHGTTVTLVYNLARANHCQRRAGKAQAAQEPFPTTTKQEHPIHQNRSQISDRTRSPLPHDSTHG